MRPADTSCTTVASGVRVITASGSALTRRTHSSRVSANASASPSLTRRHLVIVDLAVQPVLLAGATGCRVAGEPRCLVPGAQRPELLLDSGGPVAAVAVAAAVVAVAVVGPVGGRGIRRRHRGRRTSPSPPRRRRPLPAGSPATGPPASAATCPGARAADGCPRPAARRRPRLARHRGLPARVGLRSWFGSGPGAQAARWAGVGTGGVRHVAGVRAPSARRAHGGGCSADCCRRRGPARRRHRWRPDRPRDHAGCAAEGG